MWWQDVGQEISSLLSIDEEESFFGFFDFGFFCLENKLVVDIVVVVAVVVDGDVVLLVSVSGISDMGLDTFLLLKRLPIPPSTPEYDLSSA